MYQPSDGGTATWSLLRKEWTSGGSLFQTWPKSLRIDVLGTLQVWRLITNADWVVAASGLVMDTSSAFANATLGTRKDDPKARYTLIAQAIQEFQSQSYLPLQLQIQQRLTLQSIQS